MSQNQTLISCLAKRGQGLHFKVSPQSWILFLKVFFDKKHCKTPQTNIWGRNSLKFPRHFFFFSNPPPFHNLGLEVIPQQKGEADIVSSEHSNNCLTKCFPILEKKLGIEIIYVSYYLTKCIICQVSKGHDEFEYLLPCFEIQLIYP